MNRQVVFSDNTPVPFDKTVTIDHYETSFNVTVSGMTKIDAETLKRVIQNHFKVICIEQTNEKVVALAVSND